MNFSGGWSTNSLHTHTHTEGGIINISPSLSSIHKVIDLNDNTFTEVGSKAMADVLPGLQNLRVINFGDCLVRSSGAMAISNAIKDGHKKLEVYYR